MTNSSVSASPFSYIKPAFRNLNNLLAKLPLFLTFYSPICLLLQFTCFPKPLILLGYQVAEEGFEPPTPRV